MTPIGRKPHKFKAKKTVVDGITFDSKKEAKRYGELKLLERYGKIQNLVLQPRFTWKITYSHGEKTYGKPQTYIADFSYCENGERVIEDVKGMLTAEYKRKRRIMLKLFGIVIREV